MITEKIKGRLEIAGSLFVCGMQVMMQ